VDSVSSTECAVSLAAGCSEIPSSPHVRPAVGCRCGAGPWPGCARSWWPSRGIRRSHRGRTPGPRRSAAAGAAGRGRGRRNQPRHRSEPGTARGPHRVRPRTRLDRHRRSTCRAPGPGSRSRRVHHTKAVTRPRPRRRPPGPGARARVADNPPATPDRTALPGLVPAARVRPGARQTGPAHRARSGSTAAGTSARSARGFGWQQRPTDRQQPTTVIIKSPAQTSTQTTLTHVYTTDGCPAETPHKRPRRRSRIIRRERRPGATGRG
jgi:hypothetical protein